MFLDNPPAAAFAGSPLFSPLDSHASDQAKLIQSYERARAVAKAYAFTPEDIAFLSPKFFEIHSAMHTVVDTAQWTLLTIQYNLSAGTLAPFAFKRPELRPLLKRMLDFDVSAQFLLTELGHGLDARNLETTATLLPNGEFDLHTPHERAAKYMPPTLPVKGYPRVAIVIARLLVDGEDRGVRPFVVALSDGNTMCKGVSGRLLPRRGGSRYVDHALTYFNHVRLPAEALLGDLKKPQDMRINFMNVIWRVGVGSLALSLRTTNALRMCAYIAGKYSLRRNITGTDGSPTPIISFRTQQEPILYALAISEVLDAYGKAMVVLYKQTKDSRVKSGIAASVKAVMAYHSRRQLVELGERCGAQGLFNDNMISQIEIDQRGLIIAEGDNLVLCIRLASELLIGRYSLPSTSNPNSLLARHEAGLFEECRQVFKSIPGGQRSEAYNRLILPYSVPLVRSIGNRMAYDAAVQAGVNQHALKLFELDAIKQDPSWYAENGCITRADIRITEDAALSALLPRLEELLDATGAGPWASHVPLITEGAMADIIASLPYYDGEAELELIPRRKPITHSGTYGVDQSGSGSQMLLLSKL